MKTGTAEDGLVGELKPVCPRCGGRTMKEPLPTNALSRYARVYICDKCGTDEAIRDWKGKPLPMEEWAFRPPEDLITAYAKRKEGKRT